MWGEGPKAEKVNWGQTRGSSLSLGLPAPTPATQDVEPKDGLVLLGSWIASHPAQLLVTNGPGLVPKEDLSCSWDHSHSIYQQNFLAFSAPI